MNELKNYVPVVSFWILNSILLRLSEAVRPQNFELGTAKVPENLAFLWAGAWLTFAVWFSRPILTGLGIKLKGRITMFLFYWGASAFVIWILARLAEYSGLGISRFYWAIVLGLVINTAQWGLWQILKFFRLVGAQKP